MCYKRGGDLLISAHTRAHVMMTYVCMYIGSDTLGTRSKHAEARIKRTKQTPQNRDYYAVDNKVKYTPNNNNKAKDRPNAGKTQTPIPRGIGRNRFKKYAY